MAKEFKNTFQPSHELSEEAVIVDMNFMDEFVKIFLMTCAKVDEGLDGLIWIGRCVLPPSMFQDDKCVIRKSGEICNAIVHIGRLIDAYEGLIEYGKEIAEELKCYRLERDIIQMSFVDRYNRGEPPARETTNLLLQ